jgi:hypothetical protein
MIDPLTAVSMATTAYKTVQKMVNAGRDIEDTFGQMGKWYTAVSDFNESKKRAENPPLFRKLIDKTSVEEEAMNTLIHEKKLKQQEAELRTLLTYAYGPTGYQELIEMRRKIRHQREQTLYKQERRRKAFFWNAIHLSGIVVLGYGLYLIVQTIVSMSSTT